MMDTTEQLLSLHTMHSDGTCEECGQDFPCHTAMMVVEYGAE